MEVEIRGYYQGKEEGIQEGKAETLKQVEKVIMKSEWIHPKVRNKVIKEIKQKLKAIK